MCGRFTQEYTWRDIHRFLDLRLPGPDEMLTPRYNIAPTQDAWVCRASPDGPLELARCRWGLVPSWAKDEKIAYSTINARADTVAEKPAFRAAFKGRRCLVPVSAFYEWQPIEGQKTKQPWYIRRADGAPMLLAGLWERWRDAQTFTIITTGANAMMGAIHNRMPVILEREGVAGWLAAGADAASLRGMLRPAPDGVLAAHRVSNAVNNPRHDGPDLARAV
jgi:putative SOS response-associated peptidase YedK